MPPVDLAPSPAVVRPEARRLRGWGGGPGASGWVLRVERVDALMAGLGLRSAGGEIFELAPSDERFAATLGGMGLTGVILWARIRLVPVSSPFLAVDSDRVRDLDEALAALTATGGPHRVAWLDLLG